MTSEARGLKRYFKIVMEQRLMAGNNLRIKWVH